MKSIFIVVIIGLLVPVIILLLDKYASYFEGVELSPERKAQRKARKIAKKAIKRSNSQLYKNIAIKAETRAVVKDARAKAALLRPGSLSVMRRAVRDARKATGKIKRKMKKMRAQTSNPLTVTRLKCQMIEKKSKSCFKAEINSRKEQHCNILITDLYIAL
jgi:hypothetical protein